MVLKNVSLSSYFFWGYGCRTGRTHMERVLLRSLLTYGFQRCELALQHEATAFKFCFRFHDFASR